MAIDKKALTSEISSWMSSGKTGYFITLNARTKEIVRFESDLGRICQRLNGFVYGRNFSRKKMKLRIIAGIETGRENGILHAHLVVTHQGETTRQLFDINSYLRNQWYKIIGLTDYDGSMVNIQNLGDSETRISYIVKDTNYWLNNNNLNITVF